MPRRLAILDDNQRVLEARLARLRAVAPAVLGDRVCAGMVIGSVAAGRARDESDLDLLLVLASGTPRRRHYAWWDAEIAPLLAAGPGFPVQPLFVGRDAVRTTEPRLAAAIRDGIVLWDPEGVFDDESRPRA